LEVGGGKLDNEVGNGNKSNLSHQSEANPISDFKHPTSSALIDGKEHAIVPVPEADLPVELPYDVDFAPKGVPPLATASDWVKVKCPNCGGEARREVETMDTFVDSSWYFLRYLRSRNLSDPASSFPPVSARSDPKSNISKVDQADLRAVGSPSKTVTRKEKEKLPWDTELVKKWMPVDVYFGGAEHTLGHTLYSRFFVKFLIDIGALKFGPSSPSGLRGASEYAKKRVSHGVILGPDGHRMSKSRGNVVNPDKEVKKYGADTVRLYLAFLGPYDLVAPWNPSGIKGVHNFLKRVSRLVHSNLKF
jgi:leucyl-tRNA synthetase